MNQTPSSIMIRRSSGYGNAAEMVGEVLEKSGLLDAMAGPSCRVLVKPNLLHAAAPGEATTTHPEIVRGVVRALQRLGHHPIIGDSYSGAFLWSKRGLERVYRETGMADVARGTGCELSWDLKWDLRSLGGRTLARAEVVRVVSQVGFIVNVPKLKTHSYTGITCAVKNLFGVVPGHFKVGYHARFAEERRFSLALKDLALSIPVRATVVDAVVAMEGEGPAGGDPREVGAIVVGGDLQAVDRVAARFCNVPLHRLPWLDAAADTIVGPAPEELLPGGLKGATPHRLDMGVFRNPLIRAATRRLLKGVFSPAPTVVVDRCTRCHACVTACPVDAMAFRDGVPHVDRSRCIRCYCCHEACRSRAIAIRRPWLGRLLA
ncbi:DUF362 domain-containing protein [Candidatus Fermentibacteria bacterium]|nr:DUF362 domain-containing protein [Candidatus Fermentibacteria bacterium]